MVRELPVPHRAAPMYAEPRPALVERASTLARWTAPLAPVLAEVLPRVLHRDRTRDSRPTETLAHVEAITIRMLERADGTREWYLDHVRAEKPRSRRQPGRWILALTCLGLVALALNRTARSELRS